MPYAAVVADANLTAPGTILGSWSFDPAVVVALAVPAGLYLWGVRRIGSGGASARSPASRSTRRRTTLFLSGLGLMYLALQSPLAVYSNLLFSVHMVQHLVLTMVAAPLLVAGAPITVALRASRPPTRKRLLLPLLHSRPVKILTFPVVSWGLFVAAMWATHFSPFYALSLQHEWIHSLEHATYVAAALLFWWPVLGVDPAPSRMSHPARLLYLFLAMPQSTFLGLAIYGSSRLLYLHYARASAMVGVSALSDQHLAGALMWTSGMLLLLPALGFVLWDWMRREEREGERIDARLVRGHVGGGL